MVVMPLALTWIAAAALALADGRRPAVGRAALAVLAANLAANAVLAGLVLADGPRETVAGGWPPGVGIVLRADALGVVFALVSSAVLLAAFGYELGLGVRTRLFPALVLFLATGLNGLFVTGDVFNFYVFFELAMIASYALSSYGGEPRQLTGAFVFAIVNLLGSFLFLLGVAATYHVTGVLAMDAVAERIGEVEPSAVIAIAVAFFVAFGVKLGLFPFHFWLPAVYASATPGVAAILSGAVANIGSYGLLRFGADVLPAELRQAATVLIVIGSASIVYGAVQAVSRRSASEVLAYSSIGHAGYVLVALGLGGPVGIAAAVIFSIANALSKTLLFLASELRGRFMATAFLVGVLSVAGVPPTAGFFGKVELFRAGIDTGSAALLALLFLGGALSFVYMFQIYQHDFWRGERKRGPTAPHARAAALVLAVVVVAVGLWPEPLLAAGREAAAALSGASG